MHRERDKTDYSKFTKEKLLEIIEIFNKASEKEEDHRINLEREINNLKHLNNKLDKQDQRFTDELMVTKEILSKYQIHYFKIFQDPEMFITKLPDDPFIDEDYI